MGDWPAIFVSGVSSEFRSFRQAAKSALARKGIRAIVQDDFPTDYGEVREMLTRRIEESRGVLCLVGFAYGFEPRNRPEGEPRRSYTQLEYHIALDLEKPVYVLLADETARPADAMPDEDDERRALQLRHRTALRDSDDLWHPFASVADLESVVRKIQIPREAPPTLSIGHLKHAAAELFGRDEELAQLDAAWVDPQTRVLSIVAWGGIGKTSLVASWLAQVAGDDWRFADRVLDWTFYSQGTRERGGASADQFAARALEFFGDPDPTAGSPWDKGERLARLVAASRTLLVLDGVEPLQYPPSAPDAVKGRLKDPTLQALLKGLAHHNPGLCIVTTREPMADLAPLSQTTAPGWELKRLATPDGVALLRKLGVRGADRELEDLVEEVDGHALTLNLLGRFLAKAHGGDIRRRDRVRFEKADAKIQGGHAFRVMAAYERWLAETGEEGQRQLAVLRLMGFFDRPAIPGCLAALRAEPAVEGLNEHLVGLGGDDWNLIVSDLEEAGLIRTSPYEPRRVKGADGEDAEMIARLGAILGSHKPRGPEVADASASTGDAKVLDAHPLVREYFAKQARDGAPEAWREGHRRLYEHLKRSVPYRPEGLDGLQPLYQAVVHGCQAGLHQEACDEVYWKRIARGNEGYAVHKLGAVGSDLGAVACFFEEPWSRLDASLSEETQAWLLSEAAFSLRALGRLTEAIEPMRASLERLVRDEDWKRAAAVTSNLSELELTLGRVADAVRDAEQCVGFADRSGDAFLRMALRTTLADALHQAGRRGEARERFREAEAMQAKDQPKYPLLYSLRGFRYCDLLLAEAERAAWRQAMGSGPGEGHGQDAPATVVERCREVGERAAQTLAWEDGMQGAPLLDFALHHLTLGRAALYRVLLEHSVLPIPHSALGPARPQLAAAVDGLRLAGQQDYVPRGLLSRAWLRFVAGDEAGARADLDEAWEIAERGEMRLFMADVLLHRARLFRDREALAAARKLIEECGYRRRDEELRDAEEAMGR